MISISAAIRPRVGRVGAMVAMVAMLTAACSSSTTSGSAAASAGSSSGASASAGSSASAGTATVETQTGAVGTYLTDGSGRALYLFVSDTPTTSTCSGACATAWPPLTATGTPTASGQAQSAQLGTLSRTDGTTQVTYAGHPLYYFVGDKSAGQTTGQGKNGFGALWWLVAPSGTAITATSAPSGATASPSSGY
jgi:predicted lipoprotein with Yx(FWY)xxD motif